MNISQTVLEFYSELPFNLRENAASQAEGVRGIKIEREYPPLARHLTPQAKVLEIGCGVGWFSNAINLNFKSHVTGVDFNPTATNRANEIARILGTDVTFVSENLFRYTTDTRFDVVVSLGVLHHTEDCLGGLRRISEFVKPGGHIFVGLYHKYGRRPFLDHFKKMQDRGVAKEALYDEFRRLRGMNDSVQSKSWFLDQVLHPHETQHTLQEVHTVLDKEGFSLQSTSINRFEPIGPLSELFAMEQNLEKVGQQRLADGVYFPGFFVALYKKT